MKGPWNKAGYIILFIWFIWESLLLSLSSSNIFSLTGAGDDSNSFFLWLVAGPLDHGPQLLGFRPLNIIWMDSGTWEGLLPFSLTRYTSFWRGFFLWVWAFFPLACLVVSDILLCSGCSGSIFPSTSFLAIADSKPSLQQESAPSSRSRYSLSYSSGGARGHGPYSIIPASGFDWSLNFHGWKRPSLPYHLKHEEVSCVWELSPFR